MMEYSNRRISSKYITHGKNKFRTNLIALIQLRHKKEDNKGNNYRHKFFNSNNNMKSTVRMIQSIYVTATIHPPKI